MFAPSPRGVGAGRGRRRQKQRRVFGSPSPSPPPRRERDSTFLQEDFVILKHDRRQPAHRIPLRLLPSAGTREKLGLDFMAIHQPVADNAMLQAAGPNLMAMAFA